MVSQLQPAHIMWTGTGEKTMSKKVWQPNHFVSLQPIHEKVIVLKNMSVWDKPVLFTNPISTRCRGTPCGKLSELERIA